jgi:Nucleotidyltransferase domain
MDLKRYHSDLGRERLALMDEIVAQLATVPGVAAIVLGGSHARGTAQPTSDLDLAIYYVEASPFDVSSIRRIAENVSSPNRPPTVTGFYEWGPWANGGAWISTSYGKVDFLYRNIQQIERMIASAAEGTYEYSYTIYLAETRYCVPLADPSGLIRKLKAAVELYPVRLRQKIISKSLWIAQFALLHAEGFAEKGDVLNTSRCLTRASYLLLHTLFALNEFYYFGDKGALEAVETFSRKPADFTPRMRKIASKTGDDPSQLSGSVSLLRNLCLETNELTLHFSCALKGSADSLRGR